MELKTNTAVRIPIGPLVDPTDGKTAETALTVTALSVQIYQTKTDGTAVVRTQFAPTASGGSNDMALVTSSTDGMYDLELTAAQLNFLGNARLSVYDVDGFLVWWVDLKIVSANYFDNKYGSTIETVNVTQISGDSTAADNCESFFDGTGYAGTNNVIPTVTTLTGHTAQTGDSFAIVNGDHGLVSIQDDIDALNNLSAADVNAEVDTALSDYDGPTKTEMDAAFTEIKGATWASGTDTLEHIRNKQTAIETDTQSIETKVDTVDGNVDSILTDTADMQPRVAAIETDTNEIQGDLANGGRLDLIFDGIKSETDQISSSNSTDDAGSPTSGSLADVLRKTKWFVGNQWEVNEVADPDTLIIRKDDGTTAGLSFTVYTSSNITYRDNTP